MGGTLSQAQVGGYPILDLGGTPSQVRGTPSQVWRVYCPRSGGVHHPRSGGTPSQVWGGPHLRGVPHPSLGGTWGTPPTRSGWGTPLTRSGCGNPPPNQVWIRQSSIASTCYAAGGVPLAFTQEDFLVFTVCMSRNNQPIE